MAPGSTVGGKSRECRQLLVEGETLDLPTMGNLDHTKAKLEDRALASHVAAQAVGLANYISNPKVKSVFATSVMDDANLWVKDPRPPPKPAPDETPVEKAARLADAKRGKNVHMPVLNSVEHVYTHVEFETSPDTEPIDVLCGTAVHTPPQVLPAANTATIRNRLLEWSVISSKGAGAKISAQGIIAGNPLKESVEKAQWVTKMVCRDNLVVNDCVMSLEQKVLDMQRYTHDLVDQKTMLNLPCSTHNGCLCQGPIMKSFGNMPGHLVKLSHVLQSGKAFTKYRETVDKMIDDNFEYREVLREEHLPENFQKWGREARRVLHLSRPDLNLSKAMEDLVAAADNGDWGRTKIRHYCLRCHCKLQCDGDKKKSKRVVKAYMKLSVGCALVVPLLYRWKGFEQCSSTVYRARRQHKILDRCLAKMFPKKAVQHPPNQPGGEQEETLAMKQQKRARDSLSYLENDDPDATKLEAAVALNRPLQEYINTTFEAEGATTKFSEQVQELNYLRAPAPHELEELEKAGEKARQLNLSIISGKRGMQAFDDFMKLLRSYDEGPWKDILGCFVI